MNSGTLAGCQSQSPAALDAAVADASVDGGHATTCSQYNIALGVGANLGGFVPFPVTNPWNADISSAPLDPNNVAITTDSRFPGQHLHHDFSSTGGIPYVVVDSSVTSSVPIGTGASSEQSDVVVAPFLPTTPVEGNPASCVGGPDHYVRDQHALVFDRATCELYETFNTVFCNGAWRAEAEALWDLDTGAQRPWTWTSADAGGLPILPGLVRYDEVAAGEIKHALRYTMKDTKDGHNGGFFIPPATHASGTLFGVEQVMGMRIRLNATFDISSFSASNQVILKAMKQYGMILADNGGSFYFQGAPDSRWNDAELAKLDAIQSSNFEVVKVVPAFPGYDKTTVPTGTVPKIVAFDASAAAVSSGTPVTLTWNTNDGNYTFIDVVGPQRGTSVVVKPSGTTTYTLHTVNAYGDATKAVTITIQ